MVAREAGQVAQMSPASQRYSSWRLLMGQRVHEVCCPQPGSGGSSPGETSLGQLHTRGQYGRAVAVGWEMLAPLGCY